MKYQQQLKKGAFLSAFFILFFALLTYVQSLDGFFILDDYPNFYGLDFVKDFNSAINYVLTAPAGERWISYASYLLHIDAWKQGEAWTFKLINICIHFVNACLLYWLLRLLSKHTPLLISPWAAIIVAAVWFAHPIHVNTVLYSVQRMTLLAGLFVLLGLCYQLVVTSKLSKTGVASLTSWFLFSVGLALITVLGILSKESAVLLPALAGLLLFNSNHRSVFSRLQISLTYFLPYLLLIAYLILDERLGFGGRDFSMYERLLSQVVILKEYLFKLVLPNSLSFSLYYDGFEPVRSTTDLRFVFAIVFWFLLFITAFIYRKTIPVILFGLLWFFISHALESSIIPLELYFDHRNYLPSIGVILTTVLIGQYLYQYSKKQNKRTLVCLTFLVVVSLIANVLYVQNYEARLWQNKAAFEKAQIKKQPNSLRAMQGYVETLFAEGKLIQANQTIEYMHNRFGYYPSHIIYQVIIACMTGNEDEIKHQAILQALTELPADRSISDAMQSMLDLVNNKTCPNVDVKRFEAYTRAILSSSISKEHAHNLVFLLIQAYIDEHDYARALEVSYLLADSYKTRQFWFLQIGLAVGLQQKVEAQRLYDLMIKTKQINMSLFQEDLMRIKASIDEL